MVRSWPRPGGIELKDREPGLVRPGRGLFRFATAFPTASTSCRAKELRLTITDGRPVLTAVPFGLGSRLTVLPNGYVTSAGDRNEVEEHDGAAELRRVIRWPGARLPVTTDDIDRQAARCSAAPVPGHSAPAGLDLARHAEARLAAGHHRDDGRPACTRMGPPRHARSRHRHGVVGDREGRDWLGSVMLPGTAAPLDITVNGSCCATVDPNRIERVEVRTDQALANAGGSSK
jgi:hypothetical protein